MEKVSLKSKLIRYFIIIFFAVVWVIPMYIAIITPFKSLKEIFIEPVSLPDAWNFDSFIKVWNEVDILLYLKNSMVITGGAIILLGILASLAAYAILRSNLKMIKAIYPLFALGIMIPTQACMIELFDVVKGLGLYNTTSGMIFAYIGCSISVSVFLFYGYLKSIPYELFEAAYIDGCSELGLYFKIVMPLSRSAFGTVIIYNAVIIWKDFTYPLILTQGENARTLPMAIYAMKGQYISDYSALFAGILITTLPLLIIYIALQKQFIAGVTAGAIKG